MRLKKRVLSLLLTACLVVGLMPTAAFAAGTDTGKAIQLVDSGTAANIGGGQADSIYFGTYKQSSDGNSGYNVGPIKWRVLSNADGKLFLLSDQNLDVFQYHTERESVTWETSTMRSWLNGYAASSNIGGDSGIDYANDNFLDTAFSAKEQSVIAKTLVYNKTQSDGTSNPNPDHATSGGNNTQDKIFLLSIEEAGNTSYFADNNSRIATNTAYVADGGKIGTSSMNSVGTGGQWWLRSPGMIDSLAASVRDFDGGVASVGGAVDGDDNAVRPAFNLNLNSVLFTSAADNTGHISFGTSILDYNGNEWKVTLKDDNDFSSGASVSDTTTLTEGYAETTLTINHAALNTFSSDYTNVTAMLTDSDNNILYYGSISDDTSATSSTVTIPAGLDAGDYTLSVYGEDWNEANYTDYATGTPFTTTIHIHSWATDWSKNDTHHWHECQNTANCPVTDNNEKDSYAEHSFALETVKDEALKSAANCTDPATYYKSCECGAVSTSDTFTSGSAAGHSWATDWNSDSTHHWHECENSDCPVTDNSGKDGYAEHSFALETVKDEALKSAANCTDPATYYKSCECGAVSTSNTFTNGDPLGHSWATTWSSDSTHHWYECGNTNCPVTDNNSKDGYAEHTPGAEATEDTPQICTICEYVITPELGHEHNYSAILTYDSTGHWYSCTCSEKKDFAAHSFDDACDTDCNDGCGYTRSTTHSYGNEWSKGADGHWHECSVCHDKKDNAAHTPGAAATETTAQTCTECGYEITPALGHEHNYSTTLTYDSTGHWYACTCSEKKDFAGHNFDNACDTDCNDGCGYTRSTTHSYGTDWSKDASGHWYECSVCGDKKDSAEHTPGAAATETTAQTCTVCGYEIAPALGHNHSYGAWQSNGNGTHTRTCSGNSEHKETVSCSGGTATCKDKATCSVCGTSYGSTNSSNHTGGTKVQGKVDATATTAGYTGDTYCLGCNTKIKTGTTIPATGSGGGGTGGSTGGNTGGGDSGNDDSGDDNGNDTPADTPATPVTVPVSGDENTIQVGASVSGTTATIDNVDLSALNTVIGDDVKTGVVTIDFSVLNVEVDTVEIPADVVKQIAAAVNDPNNDAESLEIVLSDGTSIEFDAKALGEKSAQAGGIDITISIKHTTDSTLNNRQQQTIGNRPALDINVTSGGKYLSDMGGKVTVHAPYELRPGEKADGIVVFYVDAGGNRERCETSYDSAKKRVNWKTDHLSVYMIGYEEPQTNPDTGGDTSEEIPKSPDTGDDTPAYVTYTVQRGDTLWAIAKKYGCTVSEIVAANSDLIKNPDLIYAGWQLKIPQAGATGTDNTPDAILPDDKKTTVYIVKRGDTLWAISIKYGCTVAEIVALNGELITDPDLIFAGWELKIPQD